MALEDRGWRLITDGEGGVPPVRLWRKGSEPFCVELEVWPYGEVRGRLCAPGLEVHGTLIFTDLGSEDEAALFLEKLLYGATSAVAGEGGGRRDPTSG